MARLTLILGLLLSLSKPLLADQVAVTTFKGLNNNENAVIIGPEYASDLLNVEVTPGGKSIKKRAGYGIYKDISVGAIHGGHHFFDTTGNDVQVWGSSVSLYGIVADGTPTTLVSSATLNSTWDCVDIQGNAYCADSNRDALIKTNGVTMQWFTSPLGTMVEATPDRLVVAGVAAAPSSLYVSESNNFTNHVVGILSASPFVEPIAAPGSKLTHIRWGCGKLLWWKDQSFGYFNFEDQFTAEVKIISDTIGTVDNTSAIDPGGNVWFRGQDGHIWRYDCSGLSKESIEITPNIQGSGRRTSNSWSQSSQSDFQSGSIVPTGNLSTTISAGDVIVSSFTRSEYSSTSGWSSGTQSNMAVGTISISLILNNSGNPFNNSFETQASGFSTRPDGYLVDLVGGTTYMIRNGNMPLTDTGNSCGSVTLSPQDGSFNIFGACDLGASCSSSLQILDTNSNVLAETTIPVGTAVCSWTQTTVSSASNIGKRVKLRLTMASNSNTQTFTSTQPFILGGTISFYYATSNGQSKRFGYDNITGGSSTIATGSFTSQTWDTGFTSATYTVPQFTFTANTSTPTYSLQTAASASGPFVTLLSTTGTNAVGNRYARYSSTISITSADNTVFTAISSITVLARSTGTFYSAVKNAPNISAWSTFNPTYADNGGSHTFYMRSSSNSFTVLSSTPAWIAQSANSQVVITTYTFFQVKDDFSLTAATNTPTLSDFSLNWFEGNSSDQAYMHYFDNAIWASLAFGVGVSSNTHVFRRDLINDGWTIYNFGAGGMLTQNNRLYFGDVSSGGNIFLFGSGTSDNTAAINAYWKSKDFTGPDPFLDSALTQIDTFAKKDANQSLTATYTLNTSTATSYSIALSSTTQTIIQNRKQLPSGKNGYTFNVQYGDNTTSSAWEIFGYRVGFNQLPYRPSN